MRAFAPWAFWIFVIALVSMGLSMFAPYSKQATYFWAYVWTLDGLALAIWGVRRFYLGRRA